MGKDEVQQEYREMRASFMMQYEPELLGEYAVMPRLKSESQEDIQAHLKQFMERQERAMEIPVSEFDIDFHKFQISFDDINDNMHITIVSERRVRGVIGSCPRGRRCVTAALDSHLRLKL